MLRLLLARLLAATTALAITAAGAADAYPARPVRLVVHNNPGSSLDLIARQVAQRLSDGWKQPVVIDNRPGGGGIVGTDLVAKAQPDGYTLLAAGDGPITILPALSASLPYNPKRDLQPVASLGELDFVLVAHPRTGFRNLRDLVEAARRQPGRYTFASAGNGSPQHFAAELLKQNAGIYLTHIPYGGGPAGLSGVLAGDVDLMFIAIGPALQQIQGGRLNALAVAGTGPHPLLPGVAPVAQTYKDFKAGAWLVLFAPAATPPAVVERLTADVSRVLADGSLRSQLAAQGVTVTGTTGARLQEQLSGEAKRYEGLVRSAGIRVD
jgi:tripartite-type tricarboxylate transporter receptor subunit TctC